MNSLTKLASVGVLCLALAGGYAAAAGTELPTNMSGPSDQQLTEMSDGEITSDEYRAAFERFRSCLADGGYEVLMQGEHNATVDYSIPSAAVDSGVDAECYDREFQQVDTTWQVAREDTSRSAQHIRDCLEANGIAPDETLTRMVKQVREAGISTASCSR
ncbi:hypothetical protein [Homoserinimonas sp. A520]